MIEIFQTPKFYAKHANVALLEEYEVKKFPL